MSDTIKYYHITYCTSSYHRTLFIEAQKIRTVVIDCEPLEFIERQPKQGPMHTNYERLNTSILYCREISEDIFNRYKPKEK